MDYQRAKEVSSFTIIKGALIAETYCAFREWDFEQSKIENLRRLVQENPFGATAENWLRDLRKVLNRRFDPNEIDRPLVALAKSGLEEHKWKPLLLWHMTRDEFLVRDFFVNWLYTEYEQGTYRIQTEDLYPYLDELTKRKDIEVQTWTKSTLQRVASGLLRMAVDFELLAGSSAREFPSYHLPEESFLYLVYAMRRDVSSPGDLIRSPDWKMYRMTPEDVERELLHQHQFRNLHYQSAGSVAELKLPHASLEDLCTELAA